MATITRIEVANFLSDGYVAGDEWVPLYRGETFRLFGRSAALQIDNGGGKTSLTESALYLLSQDRRLKPKIAERIAPPEQGWTHIRMEFVEKPHDEDILQRDLITMAPEDIPGVTYVIGLAWSRSKEPNFYYYQGLLSDAPCFHKEPDKLLLVDNEAFKRSVERMPGARWNKWRNQKEWHDEIRQFTNMEVIKKNVTFQLEGAGDYSAMINKVETGNDESYDAAFFRQFVAPELLRQSMGTEGEDDEEHFEDTLYKTLKPTADALVNINIREQELKDAEEALTKFKPVEDKARVVIETNAAYEEELAYVVQDAAVVHSLTVRHPIPGMPVVSQDASWIKDGKLAAVVSSLVIDKKAGVLITDQGLATLLGGDIGRLNRDAQRKELDATVVGSQAIDISWNLKELGSAGPSLAEDGGDAQVIDSNWNLKESKRGQHRKYAVSGYTLADAKAMLPPSDVQNLADLLTRAFGIVMDTIDTNPYRKEQRRLTIALGQATALHKTAEGDANRWAQTYEKLIAESREAAENQVAYETFVTRASLFLPEHRNAPRAAKEWGQDQIDKDRKNLSDHSNKAKELAGKFETWKTASAKYAGQALSDALALLVERHDDAVAAGEAAQEAMTRACNRRDELRPKHKMESEALRKAEITNKRLSGLAKAMPSFRNLFGDVDPLQQNPQEALAIANQEYQEANHLLNAAMACRDKLDGLMPQVQVFGEVFGDADPATLSPVQDLINQQALIATEEGILSDHQPYVEALSQFHEAYGGESPEHRLEAIEQQRSALLGELNHIKTSISDIDNELNDLDTYAVADGRIYAAALNVLTKAGIPFLRLHAVAMAESGDRREAILSLFSAALSAPVVDRIEDADKATEILEKANLTVPVFLAGPLRQFMQRGGYEVTGSVTHTIFAGRATRQVKILLNPHLIAEEKARLAAETEALSGRGTEIAQLLSKIAPSSVLVAMVLKARDATRRNSEKKYAEAEGRLNELSRPLPNLKRRAEASNSIESMKAFAKLGGEGAWRELVAKTIPHKKDEIARIEQRIGRLNRLNKEDALRALLDAKDFQQEGGDHALEQAETEVARLTSLVTDLANELDALLDMIEGPLTSDQRSAAAALEALNKTFALDKRDLDIAMQFETDGSVGFMQTADAKESDLQAKVSASINRLQNIDFERAQRYIDAAQADGLALSDRIAEAKAQREAAVERQRAATSTMNDLRGQIAVLQPFIDDLHDAVVEIRQQYAKVASFSEDIRGRIAGGQVHPEIRGYAEILHLGSLGERPSTSGETKAAIANLRESIRELNIDTKMLVQHKKNRIDAQKALTEERDRFCGQARSGQIKGLQLPEIDRIAEASTLEQLRSIHQIRDKIRSTIDEYAGKLTKLRETMETNKAATVDNLVRFARQAATNLKILDDVMARTPEARFYVEAEVADEDAIKRIIESLIIEIQDREQAARERNPIAHLNKDIERRNQSYKAEIHKQIYANIFAKERVYFTHAAIWSGAKSPLSGEGGGLSTGQRTALMMMWLIKQAEYSLTRAALMYGSRKQQKAALKNAQRIMFFDGLFSNLSNEDYINHAFQGLKDVDENFQLIGLIHNPYYVNNKNIFPVHLVGKKKVGIKEGARRRFVTVEPWQEGNGMITYTSAFKETNGRDDHA
ncbi:MAG: hypothetical protein H6R04_632 [Burkholderiaceae bacterium]|nr:hypothetical protein [Burkholderiaceae bacterium]